MGPKSWTFKVSTTGRRAIPKKGFRAVEDLNTHEMITITFSLNSYLCLSQPEPTHHHRSFQHGLEQ